MLVTPRMFDGNLEPQPALLLSKDRESVLARQRPAEKVPYHILRNVVVFDASDVPVCQCETAAALLVLLPK